MKNVKTIREEGLLIKIGYNEGQFEGIINENSVSGKEYSEITNYIVEKIDLMVQNGELNAKKARELIANVCHIDMNDFDSEIQDKIGKDLKVDITK